MRRVLLAPIAAAVAGVLLGSALWLPTDVAPGGGNPVGAIDAPGGSSVGAAIGPSPENAAAVPAVPSSETPQAWNVTVFVIEVGLHVEQNDTVEPSLAVEMAHIFHCGDAWFDRENGTVYARAGTMDANVTAVVLLHYPRPADFGSGGNDDRVLTFKAGERVEVTAALNRSLPLYDLATTATPPFEIRTEGSASEDTVAVGYAVAGRLRMYPQFYPETEGAFTVQETHTLTHRGKASVTVQPPIVCA